MADRWQGQRHGARSRPEQPADEPERIDRRADPHTKRSESQRPLAEAGQGYAEGFEEAEQLLIDHAEDTDAEDATGRISRDRFEVEPEVERATGEAAEADAPKSSQHRDRDEQRS
jgi:hypothetical protein